MYMYVVTCCPKVDVRHSDALARSGFEHSSGAASTAAMASYLEAWAWVAGDSMRIFRMAFLIMPWPLIAATHGQYRLGVCQDGELAELLWNATGDDGHLQKHLLATS